MAPRARDITTHKLLSLWQAYSTFRKPMIAPSTYKYDYQKIERFIDRKMPDFSISIRMKNWVNQNYSHETARRFIQQINACCEWAKHENLHPHNPFDGMTRYFQPRKKPRTGYRAFTLDERAAIIARFEEWDKYYAPWVRFLFLTGCRPSEAAAIRWKHIHPQLDSVEFIASLRCDTREEQGTKSADRTFPAGTKLRSLLWTLQVNRESSESLLLPGMKGGPMNYSNFQTDHWKPNLQRLWEDGAIGQVLSQYHTRHTWITMALDQGYSVSDVAYLSGNTPNVIYKFYACRSKISEPPDF